MISSGAASAAAPVKNSSGQWWPDACDAGRT